MNGEHMNKHWKASTRTCVVVAGMLISQAVWTAPAPLDATPFLQQRASHPYRAGVIPTRTTHDSYLKELDRRISAFEVLAPDLHDKMLSYGGQAGDVGVTSGPPQVYLVVFGSQWGTEKVDASGIHVYTGDSNKEVPLLQRFFSDLGSNKEQWSGTMTQYCDGNVPMGSTDCPLGAAHVVYPSAPVLAGIWYDNSGNAPVIASAHDLAAEAVRAANHFGKLTADSNRYSQYVILSPPGTHPDRFNTGTPDARFCAWHDYTSDKHLDGGAVVANLGGVAFTNMPYVTDAGTDCGANFVNEDNGPLDGVTLNAGHEYAETLTDQFPSRGWTNQGAVPGLSGEENADECTWIPPGQTGGAGNVTMSHGQYALQATWSNDTNACELGHDTVH
jgi:hypothetical protein